jgi:hypothetical protein
MDQNNYYPLEGTLFAKPSRTVRGKKDPTQEYTFASIIIEVSTTYKEKTYTTFPEFELGKNANVDEFSIGDRVRVFFSLEGKEDKYKDKDGTPRTIQRTKARAKRIEFTDLKTGAKNLNSLADKSSDDVFKGTYNQPEEPEEESDLPF